MYIIKMPLIITIISAAFLSCSKNTDTVNPDRIKTGLAAADFILSLQNEDGRILDCPESDIVNEDSNMEYACIGLAAAYKYSGKNEYLEGLEKAIAWLAAREEMTDPAWKGSWYYAYESESPYDPVAVSPGDGIDDVRGVDATSALFVYLLYLHKTLSGDSSISDLYADNARAALDFLLAGNYDSGKYFYSSWQKSSGVWNLWEYRYAADQGDVYLGLRSGFLLYADTDYGDAADIIDGNISSDFFNTAGGNFATGMEDDGSLDTGFEEFNSIFPQGYLGWIFGSSSETISAYEWLEQHISDDGGIYCYAGDPGYSLTSAVFILAAGSLGFDVEPDVLDWIACETFDPDDGGICDTKNSGKEKYSNVAGFTAAALLGFDPF